MLLGAFWLGRAIGRRPNHCYNRCNRTNKTAHGAGLGPFGCIVLKPALDQTDARISLSSLSGTPLERFRVDPRARPPRRAIWLWQKTAARCGFTAFKQQT